MYWNRWHSVSGGHRNLVWLGQSAAGRGEHDEARGKCGSCGRMPGTTDHNLQNFPCLSFLLPRAISLLGLCWTWGS